MSAHELHGAEGKLQTHSEEEFSSVHIETRRSEVAKRPARVTGAALTVRESVFDLEIAMQKLPLAFGC